MGKAYILLHTLRERIRILSGEGPYAVKECGKVYYHSTSLFIHMCTHHGETPYKCKECRETSLSLHILLNI